MQKWLKTIELPVDQPDVTLREQLTAWALPRRIQGQLRQNRRVLLNGRYQNMQTHLKPGDRLEMTFLATDFMTATSQYAAEATGQLEVLWENEDVLVANKPAGIKTHPNSPGETGTLMNLAQAYLANQPNSSAYMVHRLDGATSGAIVIAKNPVAVSILNAQLKTKQITRQYVALVMGTVTQKQGVVDLPIGIDPEHVRLRKVNGVKSQAARTHWQVLEKRETATLLQLELETGRTHQIRVHMQAIGHPIVGDVYYNPATNSSRLMLHAAKISFKLPFSQKEISVKAPITADFSAIVKKS
ncbi:23S rRNA pseudouridine1911/1915/1917 synthase [Weissella uvarum]|uniref:RluA family pseudouridine synthase n=1 Tax=Weissella uvarum TaxID=1479233 RepID=UPI0019618214|nr:RluA family pseudouridine synthase [Weissella uvarum]MBM7617120.1 23S rRNA pseudouridine1911/1915/1917 synthase [Weissella uvarum]MCM0595416.1 RluA family pseudouridine synthase [Weissella uvarum]